MQEIIIQQQAPDESTLSGIERLEAWSKTVAIHIPEDRKKALETVRGCSTWRKQIAAFFADSKQKAHATWKAIVAQEKSLTDRLDAVERRAKSVVLAYDREQEVLRQREQARLQAEADERARKERARLEAQAARLKTPELKEERLEQAAQVQAPAVQVAPAFEKTQGEVKTQRWKARLVDMDALVAAAPGSDTARSLLAFDSVAAGRLAVATRGNLKVPGVEFYSEESVSFRG